MSSTGGAPRGERSLTTFQRNKDKEAQDPQFREDRKEFRGGFFTLGGTAAAPSPAHHDTRVSSAQSTEVDGVLDSQSVASNIQRNQPSMVDMNLHVAPADQGVGGGDLQELASSDGYPSVPKLNSRMDGVIYLNAKTARPERWNQAQKSWTCVCDLVSDSLCSGNKKSNRCLNTGKEVS